MSRKDANSQLGLQKNLNYYAQFCVSSSHYSEIRGLCLMKWPSKMLQNLAYFWNMKTRAQLYLGFSFFISSCFIFSLMNALFYMLTKWKTQKPPGFSYSKNMVNFEAFRLAISSSIKLLFLKSVHIKWRKYEFKNLEKRCNAILSFQF